MGWRRAGPMGQGADAAGCADGPEAGRADGTEVGRADGAGVSRADGAEAGRADGRRRQRSSVACHGPALAWLHS
jgi:hypothetical protein